jgi:outer membrane lipoprotein LolB
MVRLFVSLLVAVLAGCATPPTVRAPADGARGEDFSLNGRFSVRVTDSIGGTRRSASGRLTWRHRDGNDHVLLASPLGQGIAEIEQTPARTRVQLADGRVYEAADSGQLLADLLGYRLPLADLGAWLRGRGRTTARLERDMQGRLRLLVDRGWRIAYVYESEAADAWPVRLDIDYGEEVELRVRIEEWGNGS